MDGELLAVSSRRALNQPYVISCNSCKMAFRVENLMPFVTAKRKYHCPACGSDSVESHHDYENDRWYAMAQSFGLPRTKDSVSLLKDLYEMWDPSEHEYFKDFIKECIEELS